MAPRRSSDADRDRTPADHARRLEARPGRLRAQGNLDGQGDRGRYAAEGGRYRDPAVWRARIFEGHRARVDLSVRAAGEAGGRRVRGPQDGARALPAGRKGRFLALVGASNPQSNGRVVAVTPQCARPSRLTSAWAA